MCILRIWGSYSAGNDASGSPGTDEGHLRVKNQWEEKKRRNLIKIPGSSSVKGAASEISPPGPRRPTDDHGRRSIYPGLKASGARREGTESGEVNEKVGSFHGWVGPKREKEGVPMRKV